MKKKNILAVILARGGSKGIPKKNIYKICGHPLISYSLQAAKESLLIKRIVVSTDSKEIAKISRKYGASTPFLRSKKLASDTTTSADALYDAVKKSEKFFNEKFDYIIELPCVSPLRDSNHVDEALNILVKNKKYDSVISYVNTGEKHPIRLKRIKKNIVTNFCKEYPEPEYGSRRQDFEPCFIRNGAIYAMTRNCILNQKSRIGKNSYPMIMSNEKSTNIDEKFDLSIAQLLIENGYCKNRPKENYNDSEFYYNSKNYKNLLISAPFGFLEEQKKKIIKKFNCTFVTNVSKKNIKTSLKNKDAWLCHPSPEYKLNKDILNKLPKLKVIATPSTGTTHIDLDFCKKKKIKVLSIAGKQETNEIKASSEFTFLLILLALRKAFLASQKVKMGYWRNIESEIRGYELFNKTVGVIGYGRIGKNISKYCKFFGAKVLIFDPYINKKQSNINKVLKNSDIIVVCISYNKKNYNFINKNFFNKLKKGSIFVNSSRGEVLEENDLIKALKNNRIAAAAVDVVKEEQLLLKKNNKLIEYSKKYNNLYITPHMAGLTIDSERKAAEITIKNLLKFYK